MIFITLAKFRKRLTKADVQWVDEQFKKSESWGIKTLAAYWTLGRYDAVRIGEAPDVKTVMKFASLFGDVAATETMVGIPRDEAVALLS